MNKKILKMIEEYQEEKDFYGRVDKEDIKQIEVTLDVEIPKQYKDFIAKFGSGGICGIDLEGIEGNLCSSMLQATKRYHKLGLNKNFIVIYNLGEFIMCMDTTDTTENSKVYSWERTNGEPEERYKTFDDFIEDYFQEAIDNY